VKINKNTVRYSEVGYWVTSNHSFIYITHETVNKHMYSSYKSFYTSIGHGAKFIVFENTLNKSLTMIIFQCIYTCTFFSIPLPPNLIYEFNFRTTFEFPKNQRDHNSFQGFRSSI